MKTLVVPLDGGTKAEAALPVAAALARRIGADVVLVRVNSHAGTLPSYAYLERMAERLDGIDVHVKAVATEEPIADAILSVYVPAGERVVCMAAHGRGTLASAVLGSTAESILAATSDPVIIVGPNVGAYSLGDDDRMLVPLDGSAEAESIGDLVINFANAFALQPALVEVVPAREARLVEHSAASLERVAATLRAAGLDPITEMLVAHNVGDGIVAQAEHVGASLIAMRTHLRTGLDRIALGSATMATIRHAPCPVVVRR